MVTPHKVVIVLQSNNGKDFTNNEIENIVKLCEAKGYIGYWKRVGLGYSMKEATIEGFKQFLDFMRG